MKLEGKKKKKKPRDAPPGRRGKESKSVDEGVRDNRKKGTVPKTRLGVGGVKAVGAEKTGNGRGIPSKSEFQAQGQASYGRKHRRKEGKNCGSTQNQLIV